MVEILNYEIADKNKVCGYVDFKITINKPTTFIFRKIAHLGSDGKKWLNFPSFPRAQEDGTSKYLRYAEFVDPQHSTKLLEVVMEELKKYLVKNNINTDKQIPSLEMTEFEPLPF